MDSNRFYISPRALDKLLAGPDPEDADLFVRACLKDKDLFGHDNNEPIDDLVRLEVFMARACCGQTGGPLPIRQEDISRVGLLKWIEAAAVWLQALNPISTVAFWRRVIAGILRAKNQKGRRVYPKTRPTLSKLLDARTLTPTEMQKKHGIGRTQAYKLRREARPKKK